MAPSAGKKSCWERIREVGELGEGRKLPGGHHQCQIPQRRSLGLAASRASDLRTAVGWRPETGRGATKGRMVGGLEKFGNSRKKRIEVPKAGCKGGVHERENRLIE